MRETYNPPVQVSTSKPTVWISRCIFFVFCAIAWAFDHASGLAGCGLIPLSHNSTLSSVLIGSGAIRLL